MIGSGCTAVQIYTLFFILAVDIFWYVLAFRHWTNLSSQLHHSKNRTTQEFSPVKLYVMPNGYFTVVFFPIRQQRII